MHLVWIVWTALAVAAIAGIAVIVRTHWLQSRTLEKCVALSVLIHAVLAVVCAFVGGLAPASWGTRDEGPMTMLVVMADDADVGAVPVDAGASAGSPAAEPSATEPSSDDIVVDPPADDSLADEPVDVPSPDLLAVTAAAATPPSDLVPLLDAPVEPDDDDARAAAKDEQEKNPRKDDDAPPAAQATAKPAAEPPSPVTARPEAGAAGVAGGHRVPATYADRVGPARAAAAAARGGSQETERAVQAALAWLVAAQSADGRWNAAAHGAGRGRSAAGQHPADVGSRSDHGVTGLALLAFLGAGSTHREGVHADTVGRGIRFLLGRQRADGSLAGDAEFFASLYCHGMATLAVAECCAMSGDESLRPALDRAVRHTLAMQHPVTGGWRYAAGDRGDTSQLGWQVMVLSSARQAGGDGLGQAEARARMFLQSVSSGMAGGLAAYRPGERPSVAMTAEALVCRLLLGMPAAHPAAAEALAMISRSPPDPTRPNAYTWYYATLASFHAGGPQWDRWNAQLQAALLPLQRRGGGSLDGSWDPDPVWGGHGGRVYSTALSAMTLEVYYRYLPMHAAARVAVLPP